MRWRGLGGAGRLRSKHKHRYVTGEHECRETDNKWEWMQDWNVNDRMIITKRQKHKQSKTENTRLYPKTIQAFFGFIVAITIYTFLVVKCKLVNPFSCFLVQWVPVVAYETGLGWADWPANYGTAEALTKGIFLTFSLHRLVMNLLRLGKIELYIFMDRRTDPKDQADTESSSCP